MRSGTRVRKVDSRQEEEEQQIFAPCPKPDVFCSEAVLHQHRLDETCLPISSL